MIDLADAAAVRAEAERRRALQARGLPLDADLAPVAAADPLDEHGREKLETRVQSDVVKLFRVLGCDVYSLSQARASKQTPGLPDLWVVCRRAGLAWWWETKRTSSGRHSVEQLEFAERCVITETPYGTGDRRAAEDYMIGLGLAERVTDGNLYTIYPAGPYLRRAR